MAQIPAVSIARCVLGVDMFSRTPLAFFLGATLLLSGHFIVQEHPLNSHLDTILLYPISLAALQAPNPNLWSSTGHPGLFSWVRGCGRL